MTKRVSLTEDERSTLLVLLHRQLSNWRNNDDVLVNLGVRATRNLIGKLENKQESNE